ncbi:MAG TPA: hypothetical protein VGI03_09435 [Verrucomicrobiae bacterium]
MNSSATRQVFYLFLSLVLVQLRPALAADPIEKTWINSIQNQHDLTLPAWGPYTKSYIGISHIPGEGVGMRFDLSVFPGLYCRKAVPPNVMFESDYHPWEATPDLGYFSYRFELEWKDQVYADISYSKLDEHSRLIRAECVNNTDLSQDLELHLLASMSFPPICPALVQLPPNAVWVNALNYQTMHYATSRPTDNLVPDGKRRGEIRGDDFVDGSGLGEGFGTDSGDTVAYEFNIEKAVPEAQLVVRYRMEPGAKTSLRISGLTNTAVSFSGDGNLDAQTIPLGDLSPGPQTLAIVAEGGDPIELNGFAVVTASDANRLTFNSQHWDPKPEMIYPPGAKSLVLKYKDVNDCYGMAWRQDPSQVRQFLCKDLDVLFQTKIQNHVSSVIKGDGEGHYTDIYLRPIPVAPHTRRILYAIVCDGSLAEVERRLSPSNWPDNACESNYCAARARLPDLKPAPQGNSFEFSQQRMAATLLSNVVYPIFMQGRYLKHNTPGKWWDSLYTWDSGFIGLGLDELDTQRSVECLNAYLTEPGAQSAFIHHGSMIPVQFYLFLDLWDHTQSQELLDYAYPRLKQYYEFYVGRLGSSTTGKFKSGMLSTFDYFYNSGGWDDYPPQKYTHDHALGGVMAPVVTSAQAIRIAKIMIMAADALGKQDDVRVYQADIASLTAALEKNSWDEASGYFGYLQHDKKNDPVGILRFDGGTNYDMGMDGVYPLVAGIGTEEQKQKMLGDLKSPKRLWSPIGLTAVDQSAPYYRDDGYWNGTVWMPHQWFFWKTMLDLDESDFAWQIAKQGLELWRNETDASYDCMEFFPIETGRGAGWPEFGGLSSPVLKWYSAYCRPGTLTTGFNIWITSHEFSADNSRLDTGLKMFFYTGGPQSNCSVVVCMNPAFNYEVQWNGRAVPFKEISKGLLDIEIPARDGTGELVVSKAISPFIK